MSSFNSVGLVLAASAIGEQLKASASRHGTFVEELGGPTNNLNGLEPIWLRMCLGGKPSLGKGFIATTQLKLCATFMLHLCYIYVLDVRG